MNLNVYPKLQNKNKTQMCEVTHLNGKITFDDDEIALIS